MKKLFAIIFIVSTLLVLSSCGGNPSGNQNNGNDSSKYTCGHSSCKQNGPFNCMGKNDTCSNKTYCAYDFYCDACEAEANSKPTLEKLYNEICDAEAKAAKWITISSAEANTMLILDTNPANETAKVLQYIDDVEIAFLKISQAFDIPSYVWDRIEDTAPVDGVQSYVKDDLTIFWSFTYTEGVTITIFQEH